ncbi:MAG: A/G-specific adenine glycosylase [Bacteroidetes bacterium]|nr:MAG: A/G-specific adenine glycosylase [Bacteroidota bacterium]
MQQALADWFAVNARDLPWRRAQTPYTTYLSEILLQQTRVDQGLPYYERFVRLFPTIQDLAIAPRDEILKAWEGLGYYSRARNLHRAATEIVERFDGRIPDQENDLKSLPGIGDYTASAILSIAYGQPFAVVDGNVIRVLSRLTTFAGDVNTSAARRQLKTLATDLLPDDNPGAHNEALMELGALVCSPRSPSCEICPVSKFCGAYSIGRQEDFPVKTKKRPVPHYDIAVGIITSDDSRILIQKRLDTEMLGGLWEFPGGKREGAESLKETCARELMEELGITVDVGKALTPVKHAYSHFKITLHGFYCTIESGEPESDAGRQLDWVVKENISKYAFPSANRMLFDELGIDSGD